MKLAVKSGDSYICYSGKLSGNKLVVQSKDGRLRKGSLVALPHSDFITQKMLLPKGSKREQDKTISLQTAYHFPEKEYRSTHRIISDGKAQTLLMTGSSSAPAGSHRAILPDMAALLCVAGRFGQLADSCAVVYKGDDGACCLTVADGSIGFMRNISPDSIPREIKLSAQSHYSGSEVKLAELQKIILISDDNTALNDIKQAFNCPCVRIAVNDVVEVPKGRPSREDVIASGLASYRQYSKKLKGWNLTEGTYDPRKAVSRGLMYSIPLWIGFMYLMMAGDNSVLRKQIDGYEGRLRALAPKYREVADLQYQVTHMQQFMDESGASLEQSTDFIKLVNFLTEQRPAGLSLHTISGRFGGTVVLSGVGKSYDDVTEYVKKVKKYEHLTDVQLVYSEHAERDGVDFQMSMKPGQNETDK